MYWNPAAEQLFGWAAAEVVGHRDPTVDGDDAKRSRSAWGTPETVVDRLVERTAKGGRRLDVVLSEAPFADGEGRIRGVVTMACDAGPRIQDRRARERLLAVVSHDLRNSLATVLLNASAVIAAAETAGIDASIRDQLEWIARSAEQMDRLISDLLDASAIELGRLSHHPSRHAVGRLLEVAIEGYARLAAESSIDLSSSVEPDLPDVLVDAGRIQQVLMNLLANALKFTPAGGSVHLQAEVHRPGWVRLSVSDTGPGIDSTDLERVFEPYWQGERAGTRRAGAGLGLSIARAIVDRHGGRIWVDSAPGVGSTFSFTLPAADPAG